MKRIGMTAYGMVRAYWKKKLPDGTWTVRKTVGLLIEPKGSVITLPRGTTEILIARDQVDPRAEANELDHMHAHRIPMDDVLRIHRLQVTSLVQGAPLRKLEGW